MKSHLFLILFLTSSNYLYSDTNNISKADINLTISSQPDDTINNTIPLDTLNCMVNTSHNKLKHSWFRRNEGTLLGSFGAAIIALFSILATNFLNNRTYRRSLNRSILEKQHVYCGLLFGLHYEIDNHKSKIEMIKSNISLMMELSKERNLLIGDIPFQIFDLNFSNYCRTKLFELYFSDTKLIAYFSQYINQVLLINQSLDFKKYRDIINTYEDDRTREKAIQTYFESMIELLNSADRAISMIQDWITNIMLTFPKDEFEVTGIFDKKDGLDKSNNKENIKNKSI